MGKISLVGLEGRAQASDPLMELLSTGARWLIRQAVEADLQELLAARDDGFRWLLRVPRG